MIQKKFINFFNRITSLGGKANPPTTRFFRYSLAGGFTTSLDFLLLFFFTEFLAIFYIFSAILAYTIANSLNYIINRKWAYKETKRKLMQGYMYYLIINLSTLFIIIILLGILVELFAIHYLIARITVGVVIGIFNFIANSRISFLTPVFKN